VWNKIAKWLAAKEVPRGERRMAGITNTWIDWALFVVASPVLLFQASRRRMERYDNQPDISIEVVSEIAGHETENRVN
jgi:hypothetical protein